MVQQRKLENVLKNWKDYISLSGAQDAVDNLQTLLYQKEMLTTNGILVTIGSANILISMIRSLYVKQLKSNVFAKKES